MPSILDTIRGALKKPAPTTAQLAATLEEARRAEAAARTAVTTAAERFEASVLDDDATRQKKRAALSEARTAAEDAALLRGEAERRHAAALDQDEANRCEALYAAGLEASEAAAMMLVREYPRAVSALLALLKQLAEAQQAVATANAALPAGATPVPDPEAAARGTPTLPREIVSDEEVELWSRLDLNEPLDAAFQAGIYDAGRGWGKRKDDLEACYRKRRFRRVEYREATYGSQPSPLVMTLRLPRLNEDRPLWDRPYFEPHDPESVLAALAQIEAEAVAKPVPPVRPLRVAFEILGDVVPLPPPAPSETTKVAARHR